MINMMESEKKRCENLQAALAKSMGNRIKSMSYHMKDVECVIEAKHLMDFVDFIKKDNKCRFECLMDVCAVDNLGLDGFEFGKDKRFSIVYQFLSVELNHRLRVVVHLDEDDSVPSLNKIYKSAKWFEREAWDMYGVTFAGHNDLRRILSDYNFEGHPLRKDFPLTGYKEVVYDKELAQVVYRKVTLSQEFRDMDFKSPWSGMDLAGVSDAIKDQDDSNK